MPAFTPIPLGQRIPAASPHAVSASLPTMRAVRGYEEKDPEITRHMTSGYPRFVIHPFLHQLAAHLLRREQLTGHTLWLASSSPVADRLAVHLGAAHVVRLNDGPVHAIAHPNSTELSSRAKTFLQNIGGFLSSRAAEDRLVHHGLLPAAAPETVFPGDASAEIARHLAPAFPTVPPADLLLTSCGMSAIEVAFRTVSDLQAARGRTLWIQLGWLYLDTIALLKRFTATPHDYIYVSDVFDLAALEKLFAEKGDRIAGIFAEIPTNPLVQTPEVPAISALARRHGAALILDPSIACAFNLDVLPHADVVVSSLTKYTASDGDLTAGLVVVNPASPDAGTLRATIASRRDPLYPRDLSRLAAQIGDTPAVLSKIHASVPRVVEFLSTHPNVREVHWALHPTSRENYLQLARAADAVGSMITFTVRGSLERFYDRLNLPKGPSFGMKTTLICPFMFLAHYDLVTTDLGRAELAASNLDPNLLRLSIGTEPAAEIIASLAAALD